MPSLRSQARLEFPVQKTTRSRRTRKVLEEDSESPRKRRTPVVCVISENEPTVGCSPIKRTRTQGQAVVRDLTPSKEDSTPLMKGILITPATPSSGKKAVHFDSPRRRATIGNFENIPPVKSPRSYNPRHSTGSLSLAVPLSPRHNKGNIQDSLSPMNRFRVPTPRKSPSPSPQHSLQIYPGGISSARVLDFSSSRTSPLMRTPTKQVRIERYTPTKRALTFSPAKEMRLGGSPMRREPVQRVSPRKKLLGDVLMGSPRKTLCSGLAASPCKPGRDVLASPKKLGNPLLSSPRKELPPLSPRKLDVRSLTSPMRLAKQEGICYQRAKQALHTAIPDRIVCRDTERNRIQGFLDKYIKQGGAGSLYMSGAPGTGKTAVMSHILQELLAREDCQTVYINCMNAKNSQAIFNKVQSELQQRDVTMPTKQAIKQLEKAMCTRGLPIVLILDEVDQLDSRNQDVLYTMFEWPSLKNSRLVLIGIANALDLTDRILPRLQARPKCRPELLNFVPYTKDQIVAVLTDRLNQVSLEGHVVLDPTAVQFCARKVAAVAGDMRRALDVCRRAVESVEADVRKQPLIQPMMTLGASCGSPSKGPPVPKKITVVHIMRMLNEVYGNGATLGSASQTIPLQQKLAICSLFLMVKYGKAKEVTLGKLHDTYKKVCAKQQVAAISQSEFHSLCSLIEAKGICNLKKAKDTRMVKVTLKLDESELEAAMQDKVLVSTILANGLPK